MESTENCNVAEEIPEDRSRLFAVDHKQASVSLILDALRRDQVALVTNTTPAAAEELMAGVCEELGLKDSLELQAAFASSLGHRENIGTYYMSVNKRSHYQFVAPHSEGGSFSNMQLASFFGYENTTDGGETILMNINESCSIWGRLREKVRRGRSEKALTEGEIRKIRGIARLNMPSDTLREDDEVLSSEDVLPGFTAFDVLAKPKKNRSVLLDREMHVYWNSIESIDRDSPDEYERMLRALGLLKTPSDDPSFKGFDDISDHRVRRFGSSYRDLFRSKITHKLQPGDFVLQNNFTWCHSVSNWTPGSGVRKVAAAFA